MRLGFRHLVAALSVISIMVLQADAWAIQKLPLTGLASGNQFGTSVSSAGDLNNDGWDDVIVGAPFTTNGNAYVFFGGPGMDAVADLTLTGASSGDFFGASVAAAGDVNGDTYDDVVVGAPRNGAGGANAGRAYVFYGGPGLDNVADLTLTGSPGQELGWSVASAGDFNGDLIDDIIVGAYVDAGGGGFGKAFVFHGGSDNIADLTLSGAAGNDNFGYSVAGAGDVNHDTYDDVIVGALNNDAGGGNAGRAYVFFGGPGADATPDMTLTGEAGDDRFGISVASAGDINNDTYDDVIVGAFQNDAGGANAGRAYVYFGGAAPDNVADLTLTGQAAGERLGASVASAGDVTGDGYPDLVVGAPDNPVNGAGSGRAYLYFGGPAADNVADHELKDSIANDQFGVSVASAGDVNGDGLADVIVGASQKLTASAPGMAVVYIATQPLPAAAMPALLLIGLLMLGSSLAVLRRRVA